MRRTLAGAADPIPHTIVAMAPPVRDSDPPFIVPTREGYDRWALIYDSEDNPLVMLEEMHIWELLGDVRGMSVLDAGCGTGRHSLALAAAGADVTAFDFSAGMLARARAKPGSQAIRFLVHDLARPLPFLDASFSLVLSGLVLEHVVDLEAFFSEHGRVCRSDGALVLSAMHPAMMLIGVSARFTDPQTGVKTYPQSHWQQVSDYVMAATRAGLVIEQISEHLVDERLIARSPRAERYRGWPMLLLMRLRKQAAR
jgi:ubiquinone/menaquinone biosynthesis C-methylase UbiE